MEEHIRLIDALENEIRKVMMTPSDDYDCGVIDGLIKAIKLIEG